VLVVPSPNTQLHDVGVLVELSVNWTVSGAAPEDGELLNAATGTITVAAVVVAVVIETVVSVVVTAAVVTAVVATAAVVTVVTTVAVVVTGTTVATVVAATVVGTAVAAGVGVDVAPAVSAIAGRTRIAIKTRAASSTKKEFVLICHLSEQ